MCLIGAMVAVPGSGASLQTTVQTKSGQFEVRALTVVFKRASVRRPSHERRWRPRVTRPWTAVRVCQQFGPQCPQPGNFAPRGRGGAATAPMPSSEDCLTLNVWTPAKSNSARLPVMVWIHGGGFTIGSGARHSGEMLAGRGTVVVTFNYRLGALGFLAHPGLRVNRTGVSGTTDCSIRSPRSRGFGQHRGWRNPANVTLFGNQRAPPPVRALSWYLRSHKGCSIA
jgi:para-nitrobenzyl esterase